MFLSLLQGQVRLVLPPGFRHRLAALGAQRSERCCPDNELLEEWFQGFFRRAAGVNVVKFSKSVAKGTAA
jgi:hypothetical protein